MPLWAGYKPEGYRTAFTPSTPPAGTPQVDYNAITAGVLADPNRGNLMRNATGAPAVYDPNAWTQMFAQSPVYGAGYAAAGSPQMGQGVYGQPTTSPMPILTAPGTQPPPYGGGEPYVGSSSTGNNPYTANVPPGIAAYLDPSMRFAMDEGMRALESSASAGGQTLSGNTLRDILKFSQGLASTNYNQAFNQAAQQQQFGYQAALNDQTIPFQQRLALAQLGLTGQGQLSQLLAQMGLIQSGNLNTLGQTYGAGTVAGNNAWTNAISQILANAFGNANMPKP